MEHQIRFPHLGIVLKNVGDGINIGGFEIKYYGMIIATGFLLGLIVSYYAVKHENKFDPELVFDYLITMIIPAIVGARLYYVIFSGILIRIICQRSYRSEMEDLQFMEV